NAELGQLLAQEVLSWVDSQDEIAVVIRDVRESDWPVAVRVERFKRYLDGVPLAGELQRLDVSSEFQADTGAIISPTPNILSKFLSTKAGKKIKVIFGTICDVTQGVVAALGQETKIRVYSADITPALLELMWRKESPLQAICGLEPYFYGRCIIRAAFN